MELLCIGLILFTFMTAAVPAIAYVCFRMAFYVPPGSNIPKTEYPVPEGKIYEPYRDKMIGWMKETGPCPWKK